MYRLLVVLFAILFPSLIYASQYMTPWASNDSVLLEIDRNARINGNILLWSQKNKNSATHGSTLVLESIETDDSNISRSDDRRKYRIVYTSKKGSIVLREDDLSDSSYSSFISRVIMPISQHVLLIESETLYIERRGYHDLHHLDVFFLKEDGSVSKVNFLIGERGVVTNADDVVGEFDLGYSIVYDSDRNEYVYFNTHKEERLYWIDVENANLEDISDSLLSIEPSFDCDLRLNYVESVVCNDPGLSSLDKTLNTLYLEKKSIDGVIEDQRRWLEVRNSCIDKPRIVVKSCLSDKYGNRIHQLIEKR